VDAASLVFVRVSFGLVLLWEAWRYADYGRISSYYIRPEFLFKYYGFEWVQPWDGNGMYIHFGVLAACALMVACGLLYRVASIGLFLSFTYVFLLDQSRYLNHFYVVSLLALLMAVVPANRLLSLDARLGLVSRSEFVPTWSVFLLRAQVAIVYFYAGIAKLNHDWLRGEPMRSWLAARSDIAIIGQFFREEWAVYFFSWGGLLFDLLIVPLIAWRRTRLLAVVGAIAFHLLNARLFSIGIFPWLMLTVSTVFFEPGWPRKVFAFIERTPGDAPPPWPVSRTVLSLGVGYLAFQVAFPLRHFLYPGPVAWTEEGHRFSWRMKLRDKEASVRIVSRDAKTGESWTEPLGNLTSRQRRDMAAHPDMILQYAHHLAEIYREEGREVEIHATAKVSLNGRAPQLLVDPAVDLAKQPRNLWHASWIRPFDASATARLTEDALEMDDE
jgi:vitamin K-dependent gamma-carboxylase-like protein